MKKISIIMMAMIFIVFTSNNILAVTCDLLIETGITQEDVSEHLSVDSQPTGSLATANELNLKIVEYNKKEAEITKLEEDIKISESKNEDTFDLKNDLGKLKGELEIINSEITELNEDYKPLTAVIVPEPDVNLGEIIIFDEETSPTPPPESKDLFVTNPDGSVTIDWSATNLPVETQLEYQRLTGIRDTLDETIAKKQQEINELSRFNNDGSLDETIDKLKDERNALQTSKSNLQKNIDKIETQAKSSDSPAVTPTAPPKEAAKVAADTSPAKAQAAAVTKRPEGEAVDYSSESGTVLTATSANKITKTDANGNTIATYTNKGGTWYIKNENSNVETKVTDNEFIEAANEATGDYLDKMIAKIGDTTELDDYESQLIQDEFTYSSNQPLIDKGFTSSKKVTSEADINSYSMHVDPNTGERLYLDKEGFVVARARKGFDGEYEFEIATADNGHFVRERITIGDSFVDISGDTDRINNLIGDYSRKEESLGYTYYYDKNGKVLARFKVDGKEIWQIPIAGSGQVTNREQYYFIPGRGERYRFFPGATEGEGGYYLCDTEYMGAMNTCSLGEGPIRDIEKVESDKVAEAKEEYRMSIANRLNVGMQWGQGALAMSEFLGFDEMEWGMSDLWTDMLADYLNVDNFINTHLCEIATDEDQVTTTAFFRDGSIGAHIEGYKVPYKSEVACDEDALCQEAFEDNTYVCFKDKCADRGRNYQVLDTNVYRITFMFDPGKKVVKEGENIEFDVYIYGPNGQEIVDLSGDDDDTNDHVKLASGGEIYQKSGSDQIVFVTDKKYTKVCMEFKDTGVFTSEFKKILDDVGDGSSLCNSFVNEGHDMGPNAPGLGDFFIKLSSLGAYTGEDSGISGADPIVADVDTDVDGIADSTSGGGELRP